MADDDLRPKDDAQAARVAAILKGTPAPPAPKRNLFAAGVSSGVDQLQALSGRGLQAFGDALGSQSISDVGKDIADRNFAEAAANGRPDLENRPDLAHWTDYPAWAGYQASKQLPTLAASLLAYKLGGARLAAAVPEELAAAGASVPKFLGGGGLRAGAALAEQEAAHAAGARMVAGIASQAPVMYPQSVGSMYDEAVQSGTAGKDTARKALGLGVPYSLLEGVEPGTLSRMVEKGLAGNIAKRTATGMLINAANETVTEGVQTGMEQSFRPDLTLREKMSNIVEGAIAGGVVGGLFGGVSGMVGGNAHAKKAPPSEISTPELRQTVDAALGIAPKPEFDANGQMVVPGLDARARPEGSPAVTSGELAAPAAAETGRRVYPEGSVGTARWARHEDVGGRTAEQIVRDRMAAEGAVRPDTSVEPRDPNQLTMDLVDPRTKAALPEQRAPAYDPEAEKVEAARRQTIADQVGTKAKWAAPIIEGARTPEDVAVGLQQLLDHYDSSTKRKAPDGLIKSAVKNGLLKEDGTPRDLQAEVNEATAKNEALWRRANDTGTAQDRAKATKFQNDTLKPLVTLAETVGNARKRVEALYAQQPETEGPTPSTAAEAAAVLQSAPPVAPPPNLQQRFATRGVAPAPVEAPVEAAATTVAPVAPEAPAAAPVDPTAALQARWAAGKVQPTVNPAPVTPEAAATPSIPAAPLAQGARFTSGGLGAPVTGATQYVTKQDKAKAARAQKATGRTPVPETAPLAGGTSFSAEAPKAPQAAADIGPLGTDPRATFVREAKLAKLRRIASDPSPVIRGKFGEAATEAHALMQSFGPSAESVADKVLGEYAAETGDVVFSRRTTGAATPPMQKGDYETALKRVVSKLPASSRANVVSVATEAELPPAVLHAAEAQGMHPGSIRGVLYDGKAYVVQEHVSSEAQLQEVVDHEVWGHGASRALFGDQRITVMGQTFDLAGGLEGLRAIARKFGVEKQLNEYLPGRDLTARDKAELVDELLAQAAGKASGKFSTMLRAWVSLFKNGLIKVLNGMGLTTAAERLNKFDANDLAAMMTYTREALKAGQSMDGLGASFSKTEQETIRWTQKRIDAAIHDSDYSHIGSRTRDATRYVAWVNPESFLAATATGDEATRGVINKGSKQLYPDIAAVSANEQTPFLLIKDGRVVGHEGRHRMAALSRKGVTSVPVIVDDRQGGIPREPIAIMKLGPQGGSTGNVNLTNLIPLNEANRAAIEAKMLGSEVSFLRNTPQGLATSAQNIMTSMSNFDKLMETYNASQFSDNFNRFHLYSSTTDHIAQFFGAPFKREDGSNILQDWVDALRSRTVTNQLLAHMHRQTLLHYENVRATDAKVAERIERLMGASYNEMDPRKTWDEHTWLHKSSNAEQMKAVLAQHNADYRWLKQNSPRLVEQGMSSPLGVYEDMIHSNEMQHYAQQALSLYNIMMRDGQVAQSLKDTLTNPMDGFLADAAHHSVPQAAKLYWLNAVSNLKTVATDYVAKQKGAMSTAGKADADSIKSSTSTLLARVAQIELEHRAMEKAPYFHIGRFGDFVLKFNIRKLENGGVDPAAYERIAKALSDAKIENVVIPTVLQNPDQSNVFIRFENKGSWTEGVKLAHALQKEGVAQDVAHFDSRDEAKTQSIAQMTKLSRELMDTVRSTAFGGTELTGDDQELAAKINREFQHHLTQFFINQLPDVATNKVMLHRNYVAGFSPDMVRAYVQRSLVGSRSLATLHASSALAKVSAEMTGRAREMRTGEDMHAGLAAQRTVNELFTREAQRPAYVKSDFVDAMRATTHTAFLGLSPGYIATQLTSLGTTLWPELSKKYGFVQSAKAIGKVTPMAFNILRQTVLGGGKSNWRNMADATITREVLDKAGVKGAQAEFIMRLVNSGALDIGTQSRELGSIAEGTENSKTDTLLRWGSAAGYYSEMLTRLVAALSARELHGGYKDDMFKYAVNTVNQSMFTFSADNMARAVGRQGIIGRFTPLVAQFQSYMFMLTEKLMREVYTGFRDAAATPAEKKEARRFLLAHMTAMTTIAGTLGLPMAAVFAKVLDKAVDWTGADDDDEPFNSQVALRNWLNDTFGPAVGNVLARGAPHALGFDISKRVGEQDLLPFVQTFSKLLTSRREWKEAIPEWLDTAAGSSAGLISNVLEGGDLVMSGRYLDGAVKMSPTAVAGPLRAWQLSRDGYVDSSGNKQPMSPSAWDYFLQSMGFNPAAKADLAEANAAQASLKSDMAGRASVLRRNLVMALEKRDMESAQTAYTAALEFDAKHPDYAILPRIGGLLKSRASARAKAAASGTPLGVRPTQGDSTRFFDPANY